MSGEQSPKRVAVIIGSTRSNRICDGIARMDCPSSHGREFASICVHRLGRGEPPFLDEPLKPESAYEHEHTRSWSRLVSSFDAFVLVFPQYNWDIRLQ